MISQYQKEISKEWKEVLSHYLSIPGKGKREVFLRSLSESQRDYLLKLVSDTDKKSFAFLPTNKSKSDLQEISSVSKYNSNSQLISNIKKSEKSYQSNPSNQLVVVKKQNAVADKHKFKQLSTTLVVIFGSVFGLASFVLVSLVSNYQVAAQAFHSVPVIGELIPFRTKPEQMQLQDSQFDDWVKGYIKDGSGIQRSDDPDLDGITNQEEQRLGLTPNKIDQNSNGIIDGVDILQSLDPLTNSRIDIANSSVYNRIHPAFNLNKAQIRIQKYLVLKHIKSQKEINKIIPNTTESGNPKNESFAINIEKKARLIIPESQIDLPIQFSSSSEIDSFEEKMSSGEVVHYPSTPNPGLVGKGIYAINPQSNGEYSSQFSSIDNLEKIQPQAQIVIVAETLDKQKIEFRYRITKKDLVAADDNSIFKSNNQSQILLTTPWTLDSLEQRMILQAQLVEWQIIEE